MKTGSQIERNLLQAAITSPNSPEKKGSLLVRKLVTRLQTVPQKSQVVQISQLLSQALRSVRHLAQNGPIEILQNLRLIPEV